MGLLLELDGMAGFDRTVVVCPGSTIAEQYPAAEPASESCKMDSGSSLGSMGRYPVAAEGVGLADSAATAEHMDSETGFGGLGMGYGSGSQAADWAGLAMGCPCYSKPCLRCLCGSKVA